MSLLIDKRFTVVLPDKTFNLVHDESAALRSSSNKQDDNGTEIFFFGFKDLDNSGDEGDLKSAVAVYNVSRDVNGLNDEKGDLHIASVFLRESERRIHRGVAVSTETGDVQNISKLREIFHKYGINTVFKATPINTDVANCEGGNNECMRVSPLNSENWTTLLDKGDNFRRDSTQQSRSVVIGNKKFCPVFQDLPRARYIIEKCAGWMKEARELLEIFDKNVPQKMDLEELKKKMKFKFIVVEGLDAGGKTTLTKNLEIELSAKRFSTPPPQTQHLRKHFDDLPEIIRRAYYALGNYIVAVDILKTCQEKAVIMDRYWHSTTAYGIANETSSTDIPQEGHWAYDWPADLLTPDLVLFLSVSEEIRQIRMKGRGGESTQEEKHLKKDRLFRERLYLAYKRMRNPKCTEIDASGSMEKVLELAREEINKLN